MKIRLLEHLRCPTCEGQLVLKEIRQKVIDLSDEDRKKCLDRSIDVASVETVIEEGILLCHKCSSWYAITNFVPILLTFPTKQQENFYNKHKQTIDELGSFTAPHGIPLPGECLIQQSFSKEWGDLGLQDNKFELSQEELRNHLRVELDWPEWVLQTSGKRLLEVGSGLGQESIYFEELTGNEIFAVDLNTALINVGSLFAKKPFIHIVVASLFKIPFSKSYFDVVFSNGVLHHTFSTRAAFHSIRRYLKYGGMIYIWLYARETRFGSLKKMPSDLLGMYARPIIAKLPYILQNIVIYPISLRIYFRNKKSKKKHPSRFEGYTFDNAVHEARDGWTPLYAHHESIIKVIEWFQEEGLEYRLLDTVKFRELVGRSMYSGFGIRGIDSTTNSSVNKHLFRFIDSSESKLLNDVLNLIETLGRRKLALFSLKLLRKYTTLGSRLMRLSISSAIFLRNTSKVHKWTGYRFSELLRKPENIDFLIVKLEQKD